MANTKISDLTDGGDAQSTDRFAIARDPTGSSLSRWTDTAGIFEFIKGTNATVSADWTLSSGLYLTGSDGLLVDVATAFSHGGGKGVAHFSTADSGQATALADADELVLENSADSGLSILSGATSEGTIAFGDSGDADIGYIKYDHTNDAMIFRVNTADAITIASDGDVGVGTGTPDGSFHIMTSDASAAAHADADDLVVEVNGTGGMSILGPSGAVQGIFFGDAIDNDIGKVVYDHSSNTMSLVVGADECARFDSTGMCVGTLVETPTVDLHVRASDSGVTPAGNLFVESSGGTILTVASGATSNSTIAFSDSTGGANEGYILYNHTSNRLVLKSAAVEAVVIDEQGTLNVAENGSHTYLNSDFHALEQSGGAGSFNTVIECSSAMDSTASVALETRVNGTRRATIYGNGNGANVNDVWGTYSDRNLKENITDAGSQWDDIKKIKLRKFNLKSDPRKKPHIGVIAQELEQVSPGLVDNTVDSKSGEIVKMVKSSLFTYKLIGALQEAMERIEALERKK